MAAIPINRQQPKSVVAAIPVNRQQLKSIVAAIPINRQQPKSIVAPIPTTKQHPKSIVDTIDYCINNRNCPQEVSRFRIFCLVKCSVEHSSNLDHERIGGSPHVHTYIKARSNGLVKGFHTNTSDQLNSLVRPKH